MSYQLQDNTSKHPLGYSFLGKTNGEIDGTYTDIHGQQRKQQVPVDIFRHIIELNESIEINIENSIRNVIESLVVVDAYLNVICSDNYQNAVCDRMQCKLICNLNETITPDHKEVKNLLLRLADHHNKRPLTGFLEHAIAQSQGTRPASNYENDSLPAYSKNNSHLEQQTNITFPDRSANYNPYAEKMQGYSNVATDMQQLQQQQQQQQLQLQQQQLQQYRYDHQLQAEGSNATATIDDDPIRFSDAQRSAAMEMELRRRTNERGGLVPQDIIRDPSDLTEEERLRREEIIGKSFPYRNSDPYYSEDGSGDADTIIDPSQINPSLHGSSSEGMIPRQ